MVTDLKKLAGNRYCVRDDGTADADRSERIWCLEIRGKHGRIYPQGWNGDLAVCADSWRIGKRLAAMGHKQISGPKTGCTEAVFRFPPADLDRVAEVIQAKKRRHLSPEARVKAVKALAGARARVQGPDSLPVSATLRA